jgi:predicted aldo/keto reductase-like oxidoreductase
MPPAHALQNPARFAELGSLGSVCRLGLSTRGNTALDPDDVLEAFRRGVRYFNWCGHPDGMSRAVRRLEPEQRREVVVALQLAARDAKGARKELDGYLGELGTDYVDVVTYYYVEQEEEWTEIHSPGGAAEALQDARREGVVRAIGVTTHQRRLGAQIARDRGVDLLMIRYNAAHRGAETDVVPVTDELGVPVVVYTGVRWGALMTPTPEDPEGFRPPGAPDCYRFALCHPSVGVVLMAPNGRAELEEDLAMLDDWRGLREAEYAALCEHGDRVRRHAGSFP